MLFLIVLKHLMLLLCSKGITCPNSRTFMLIIDRIFCSSIFEWLMEYLLIISLVIWHLTRRQSGLSLWFSFNSCSNFLFPSFIRTFFWQLTLLLLILLSCLSDYAHYPKNTNRNYQSSYYNCNSNDTCWSFLSWSWIISIISNHWNLNLGLGSIFSWQWKWVIS